jgi:hypothetical protein
MANRGEVDLTGELVAAAPAMLNGEIRSILASGHVKTLDRRGKSS